MKKITLLLAGSALLLSGCAGVKSSFDCDATTSDTCMTMTKANQLARDKAAKQSGKPAAGGLPSLVNLPATSAAAVPSASRAVVNVPSDARVTSNRPVVSAGAATGISTNAAASTLTPRPVAGTPVTTIPSSVAYRPVGSVVTPVPAPSCQSVRCDHPGSVHPQRSQDQIATVWIAPWVDSDNAFHQPGRVSFVVNPADWVLPSRVN
ncbi:type IV conjugative transfer system lipoprotein TraV [Salmonella enterica]|nr:type IV conjugative transfer system lipoprotein TraV [Salmonella enterica]